MELNKVNYKDVTIFVDTSNATEVALSCCKTDPAGLNKHYTIGEKVYITSDVDRAISEHEKYLDMIHFTR